MVWFDGSDEDFHKRQEQVVLRSLIETGSACETSSELVYFLAVKRSPKGKL